MKLSKLLFPLITFIVIITSCGKDDLPTADNGLTAKPSMLADHRPSHADGSTSTPTGKLDVPVLSFSVDGSTVKVSWTAIKDAVGYHVNIEQGPITISEKQKDDQTFLTATFDLPNGDYTVKVKAKAATGQGTNDSHWSEKTNLSVNAEAPKAQLATPVVSAEILYHLGLGSATVSWNSVTHATGYLVNWKGQAQSETTTSFSKNDLEPGTYTGTVTATAAGYPSSDPGTFSITVKARRPISTPAISGTVSYTAASAGTVTVNPKFIWPPNNKLTTVTFVGSGLSTGTGSISASHTQVAKATSYIFLPSSSLSGLAPGDYPFTIKAIAGDTYDDDNWVNSLVGSETFTVLPGSLKGKLFDEYGVYTKDYELTSSFNLPLQLMASRLGTDKTGRDYTFTITATNGRGTAVTGVSAVSNVPHDQR